jgi:hypothetical protein
MSTDNFVRLASLRDLPQIAETQIKLVSIPKAILAVATRDPALPLTDVSQHCFVLCPRIYFLTANPHLGLHGFD